MMSNLCRLTKARVEPITEKLFQFPDADFGFVADILAVRDWSGALMELIAWRPEAPHRWWLRRGDALALLGDDLVDLAKMRREPLLLVATPAEWWAAVQRDATAICVADWSTDPRLVMTGLEFECSRFLFERVQRWWQQWTAPTFTARIVEARHVA
jgi:hypothetical protein